MSTDSSSGIDQEKVYELKSSMGILTDIPILNEVATSVAMVLLACGDANGFIADQLTDVISELNAFILSFKMKPAETIIQLNSDKKFIESQITILQTFLNS